MPEEVIPNLEPETEEVPPVTTEPEQPPAEPTVPPVDYEKKFSESARENQLLRERLDAEEKARQEFTKEPTDSELRTAFPEWELMSDTEKRLARELTVTKRISGQAVQTAQEIKADRSLATSIDLVLASNTALQGKEQAFRQYATRPQYKGIPMEVLVGAFLQSQGSAAPAPAPTPKPGLEPGNSGPRTPEKPKTLTAAELSALRTSDEKAYMAYVKTHAVDVDSL
jgi:hypothetical protein